jgi:hypothetical protein
MLKHLMKTATLCALSALVITSTQFSAHADENVTTPFGKSKLDALVQFWGVNDTSLGVAGTPLPAFNMKIRRAEIGLSGAVTDTTHYGIMVDPSRLQWTGGANLTTTSPYWETDTSLLRDAWISQQLVIPELELKVGQFKTPTTAEGLDSNAELMFPERSMVARTFGDDYEPGFQIGYKAPMWKVVGMMSNGHGPNTDDFATSTTTNPGAAGAGPVPAGATNPSVENRPNNKNLSFRGDVKPMEMVSAGAFTTLTNFAYSDRFAAGVNVRVMPIEDLVIRFEGVRGRQTVDAATGGVVTTATANQIDIPMNGWTVDVGYQYGDFQPVFRFETQQAQQVGSTSNSVDGRDITFGMNYFFSKHNYKLQFAYSILNNVNGSAFGSTTGTQTATGMSYPQQGYSGGLAVLAFQAAL